MIIKEIRAVNFRNITGAELTFSKSFNFISGRNAQGKTSLLEAIHIFSLGRSFRTSKVAEMISFGADYFYLKLGCESDTGICLDIELSLEQGGRIRAKVNGDRQPGVSSIIGLIPSVIFTPGDVELSSGPPAGRRLFADYTAAQISPSFLGDLKEFRRILAQRNSLLRKISAGESGAGGLAAWNSAFVEKGASVARGRGEILSGLAEKAAAIYGEIRGGERFGLAYRCSFGNGESPLEEALAAALVRVSENEKRRGYSLAGPQYDDIALTLDDVDLRKYGSQGRKRLVAIVMKLAQAATIMEKRAERPVVLLDDIFSELDPETSAGVRRLLSGGHQSFITSPGKEQFDAVGDGGLELVVEDGVFEVAGVSGDGEERA
ncbi:MAG: DNA replication and repair protein RecF [Candidatus Krumholzibacteria bacterium]|nr:DNA replication and repair protein RecF [Candidatus Krumholzibacteria bacterium]